MTSAQVSKFQKNKSGRFGRLLHSVRFRLSLWYVIILAIIVIVFGSVIYSVESATLSGEIDAELNFTATKIPQVLATDPGTFRLNEQVGQILNQFLNQKNLPIPPQYRSQLQGIPLISNILEGKFILTLVDSKGQITQSLGALDKSQIAGLTQLILENPTKSRYEVFSIATPPVPDEPNTPTTQDYRVFLYPVNQSNGVRGTIVVGLPWEGAVTLRVLLIALLLTGGITLLLAAAGGFWLASRAMRPVSDITRTARNISETDLSRRLNNPRQDEIGELAGTFDQMLGRLQSAFERQRQFTADASHELRTPLTIINLEVNRSLARLRSPAEYARALEVIQVENEYMTHLVEDLLLLARADAGQTPLQTAQLDLSDLALEVVERLEPLAEQKGIRLVTGELPEILVPGDRHYLTQMLANLVENAIKYTAGSGDLVRVDTGKISENGENYAWLKVKDNGPGIAPGDLPYLFDRFYQADHSRSAALVGTSRVNGSVNEDPVRGSGLGLSIVKWVVDAHQGIIRAESEPGQGATFEVRLPLA